MNQVDISRYLNLVGLLLGFLGTIVLVRFSYSLQPFEGGFFGSVELDAYNKGIAAANERRMRWQRRGLYLLSCSFLAQAAAVCLS